MRASLHVNSKAIQTRCVELSLAVINEANGLFGLSLGGLDSLQKVGEPRARLAALKESSKSH